MEKKASNNTQKEWSVMDNRCICCGEIIPEGLQVCPNCMVVTKLPHNCEYCKWRNNFNWICKNTDSDYFTEITICDNSCECWEQNNDSENPD